MFHDVCFEHVEPVIVLFLAHARLAIFMFEGREVMPGVSSLRHQSSSFHQMQCSSGGRDRLGVSRAGKSLSDAIHPLLCRVEIGGESLDNGSAP
ncbi:hypothetical protein ACFX2K_019034 [Malus domestica]